MKAKIKKSNVKARSANEKGIEHGIAQKTALSKKSEKEISGKAVRTVNKADNKAAQKKPDIQKEPRHVIPQKIKKTNSSITLRENISDKKYYEKRVSEQNINGGAYSPVDDYSRSSQLNIEKAADGSKATRYIPSNEKTHQKNKSESVTQKGCSSENIKPRSVSKVEKKLQKESRTNNKKSSDNNLSVPKPPKHAPFKRSKSIKKRRRHKVLKNGTVSKDKLLKKKERVIYAKKPQKLQNVKPKKIENKALHSSESASAVNAHVSKSKSASLSNPVTKRRNDIAKRYKNKKIRIKRLKQGQQFRLDKEQSMAVRRHIIKPKATDTAKTGRKKKVYTAIGIVGRKTKTLGKAVKTAAKPVSAVGDKLLSQRANTDKTEDSGTEAVKLGLQMTDYAKTGITTAGAVVDSSVKAAVDTGKFIKHHLPKKKDKGGNSVKPANKKAASGNNVSKRKKYISKRYRNKKMRVRQYKKKSAAVKQGISKTKFIAAAGTVGKTVGTAGKAAKMATKPVSAVGDKLLSQRADIHKTEDSGTEAVKLGLQTADYAKTGGRAIKTAVDKSGKAVRKVSKKIERHISGASKRKLKKTVSRKAGKATKAAAKTTAKTAADTAKKAARSASKAAQAAVKAVASGIARAAGFIASTMPYSLIIIGVIAIVIILSLCLTQIIGGAGGSVAGGGAWLVDDETLQSPEEIYEGYKEYIEQARSIMESQAKEALKGEITAFCDSDTDEPRKIIQYRDKEHSLLFYPASGADSTINPFIDEFGTDDYADYLSLLFVLMTRERQQAEGVSDGEIYDFDFEPEDFQEFMKTVNENSCRWGDTFVIKIAVETTGEKCPGENCKSETRENCQCGSATDSEGHVHTFCKGHPYCPENHTKLTATLYTVKDFYGKDYPEIYDFTDNEKARYEASKAIIQAMLDYWE